MDELSLNTKRLNVQHNTKQNNIITPSEDSYALWVSVRFLITPEREPSDILATSTN